MDCKEFSNLLDAYMEGALPDADARRMAAHAAECASCASLLALRRDLRRMEEEIEVPDAFSSSWRRTIREEKTMESQERSKFNWKAWVSVAAALIFVVGGTLISRESLPARTAAREKAAAQQMRSSAMESAMGLMASSAASNSSYESGVDMYMAEDADVPMEYEEDAGGEAQKQEKIIRTASFTVKTTAYDEDLESLQRLTADLGGRVEYLSSSGDAQSGQARSASLTLRIPSARLDEFLEGAKEIGTVTALTQEMQDVSDSYYDTKTRLETQQEKLKRLQSMIASAEDVSDLIEIETAIADTQYYIDRYTGQLKGYDSKVDFSTVRVNVRETRITEMANVTLGQRIVDGLKGSAEEFGWFLEDAAVFLVSALPWLLALAAAGAVLCLIVRSKKKKKMKKQEG